MQVRTSSTAGISAVNLYFWIRILMPLESHVLDIWISSIYDVQTCFNYQEQGR